MSKTHEEKWALMRLIIGEVASGLLSDNKYGIEELPELLREVADAYQKNIDEIMGEVKA